MKMDWMLGVAVLILSISGINALVRVFGAVFPLLDTITAILGFFGFLMIIYAYNEYKFKSLLDITILVVAIAALGYIAIGLVPSMVATTPILSQIVQGFTPLIIGIIVGTIVTIPVGILRLKKQK